MSADHPIVSVLGAAGAGASTITRVIDACCRQRHSTSSTLDGDGFHRYSRADYQRDSGLPTHFHPDANHLDKLEQCLQQYSATGCGQARRYLHDEIIAGHYNLSAGEFTDWAEIPASDFLIYEGLHGCYVDSNDDIAQHMDLKIGVVPIVNLEWKQRTQRDIKQRGYDLESIRSSILSRMPDYVHYIVPQFSRTDINIQAIPLVDTSNPLDASSLPEAKQIWYVIRESHPERTAIDFPGLLSLIPGSFMSRHNSIVVPGAELDEALRKLFLPLLNQLLD